jgi:cyclophilin family peptidyl-prolyl cis-trans isomerase
VPSEKRQRQRENSAARAAAARAAQQRRANRRRGIVGGGAVIAVVAIIALFVVQSTGGGSKKNTALSTTKTTAQGVTTTVAGTTPTTAAAATSSPPMAAPVPSGGSITASPPPCPNADGSSPRASHFASAPGTCIDPTKNYTATFTTTQGSIVVALDTAHTAGTVNNFVFLARYHYYDGSSFDRIDQSIDIIQGGSPSTQTIADPGPGYTINDEGHFTTDAQGNLHGPYTYAAGDLVMARGSGPKSASAQYFFVYGPAASQLDSQGTYVVFGHVTTGLSILQNIGNNLYEPCPASDQTCLGGAPKVPIVVKSVTISES